jgi:predicted amidophosphoribosyltransferase
MELQMGNMRMSMGGNEGQTAAPEASAPPQKAKRFCTQCGQEAAAEDRFCGGCGHHLKEVTN